MHVKRDGNRIGIQGDLVGTGFRSVLSALHECTTRMGYEDVILDFYGCTSAFPVAMLPVCAAALSLRDAGKEFELVLPQDEKLSRLFVNSNWAGLISEVFPLDTFRGYIQIPATRFIEPAEQQRVVDRVLDSILKSTPDFARADFAALEWAISELTDNVVNHADSKVGGLIQYSYRRTSKRIDIVVCDAGRGIPATLMPAYPQIPTEYEALAWAIREGVTRDTNVGQGNGLFGSSEIAKRSGGYFRLHSSHGSLMLDDQGLRLVNERVPVVGTLVDVCMSCAVPNVLASALRFGDESHTPTDYIFLRYQADTSTGEMTFSIRKEAAGFGSRAAGRPIRQQLSNLLRMSDEPLVIDFGGLDVVSSSFADEAIGKLVAQVGLDEFQARVKFHGLAPTVKSIVSKAISQRLRQEFAV